MNCNTLLQQTIREKDSLVCVGLDVRPERIPPHLRNAADPVFEFNRRIIDATADLAAAYKPNLAYYEALGTAGWDILKRTVDYIPEGVIKIGDAKRGDIGTTAEHYAKALYDLGFDMVTVNPYLGLDSVKPFIEDETKGVFILCLTSNKSSRDFQYMMSAGRTLYQHVAEAAVKWNERGNIGLVAGATHPDELADIRSIAPGLPLLIPGIGAQGGDLEAAVTAGTDAAGEAALINSSRGIIYASDGSDFAEAAGAETRILRDSINRFRRMKTGT